MKYTTKELINMSNAEREEICKCRCEEKGCPFKKSLWKYREDGYCIADVYKRADRWIKMEHAEINHYLNAIKKRKEMIKHYKKAKKVLDKEME